MRDKEINLEYREYSDLDKIAEILYDTFTSTYNTLIDYKDLRENVEISHADAVFGDTEETLVYSADGVSCILRILNRDEYSESLLYSFTESDIEDVHKRCHTLYYNDGEE